MKKKLIAITLLTLSGGLVTGTLLNNASHINYVHEVAAQPMSHSVADEYIRRYQLDLSDIYFEDYKIHYEEIKQIIDEAIAALSVRPIDMGTVESIKAETDSELEQFESDHSELSHYESSLRSFITYLQWDDNLLEQFEELLEPYNFYLSVEGLSIPSSLQDLVEYVTDAKDCLEKLNIVYKKLSYYANSFELDEELAAILDQFCSDINGLNCNFTLDFPVVKKNLLDTAGPTLANIYSAYETAVKDVQEYYIYNISSNYYEQFTMYVEKTDELFEVVNHGLEVARTEERLEYFVEYFENVFDYWNSVADKAWSARCIVYILFSSGSVEDLRQTLAEIDEYLAEEDVYAMIDGYLHDYNISKEIVDLFDEAWQSFNSIKEELPFELQALYENALYDVERSVFENHSISLYDETVEEVRSKLQSALSLTKIRDLLVEYIDTYYVGIYECTSGYSDAVNDILDESYSILSADSLSEAYEEYIYYCEKLDSINQCCNDVVNYYLVNKIKEQFSFTDENYLSLLNSLGEVLNSFDDDAKRVVFDMVEYYERAITGLEFYEYFKTQYQSIESVLTLQQKVDLADFLSNAERNLSIHINDTLYEQQLAAIYNEFNEFLGSLKTLDELKQEALDKIYEIIINNDCMMKDPNITTLKTEWEQEINDATSVTEIEAAVNKVESYLATLLWNEYIASVKEEIQGYYDELNKSNWNEDTYAKADKILNKYLEELNECHKKQEVELVKKNAKKELNSIFVVGRHTRKGCGSSIVVASSLITILSALGTTFVLRKKKEEK